MSAHPQSRAELKHELRTPLNHIIGFCEMLMEEASDEGVSGRTELVPGLERIHAAGRRLIGVITDLVDDSIPESERFAESRILHEIRTPLNHIICDAEQLQEDAMAAGEQTCADDLGKVRTAANKLLDLAMTHFG